MADRPFHQTSGSAAAIKDTIYVRNLRLAAVFERDAWARPSKTQPVIICLQLQLDTSQTGSSDNLQHSFSYGQICKEITSAVDAKNFVDIDGLTNALCEAARLWPGQEIAGQVLLPKAFLRVDGGFLKHFARFKSPKGGWERLEDRWVIEGIKAACIIGINPHERLEKQTVHVDLIVSWTRLAQASGQRSLLRLSTEQWQGLVKRVLEVRQLTVSNRMYKSLRQCTGCRGIHVRNTRGFGLTPC